MSVPIIEVPMSLLEWGSRGDDDRPIRSKRPPTKVTRMHKFVKAGGVLPPIIVWAEKDGFHVREGRHRIYVHLDNGGTTILAKVCKDRDEAYREYAAEMEARK